MKRLLILIILFLTLTTGCYDYKEIEKLAIISAIGIDYEEDKYQVTFEILNDKIDKKSAKITSYTKTASGKTLAEAINNASDKLTHQANYSHIKLMVISENIVKKQFSNIMDYFLRSTYFRENFYVISTFQNKPSEILNNTTNESPIASTALIDSLENNKYSSDISVLKSFDQIIAEIITFGLDTCFTNISLNDKEFLIDGLTTFHNFDYNSQLTNDDAKMYNILTSNFYRPIITNKDKNFTISILTGKPQIEIDENKITVSGNLYGKIIDNIDNIDIRNLDNLQKINQSFSQEINQLIFNFIKTIQLKETDILGLSQKYYAKNRSKNDYIWKSLDITSNIEFKINKKGIIYEVQNEN